MLIHRMHALVAGRLQTIYPTPHSLRQSLTYFLARRLGFDILFAITHLTGQINGLVMNHNLTHTLVTMQLLHELLSLTFNVSVLSNT